MNSLYDILDNCVPDCFSDLDEDYVARMMQPIPDADVIDRENFILRRCDAKAVMSLGGSGPLEEELVKVVRRLVTVDRVPLDDSTVVIDLDVEPERIVGLLHDVEYIVCGELLEHLSNPGRLLDAARKLQRPMVVTTPNAFTQVGRDWLQYGYENVNKEHVSYYSHHTLKNLLERHGFEISYFAWYKGMPKYSEGLIFEVQ